MNHPLLAVRNLSKTYITSSMETRALREVSFDIERGEFVAISGPSGCGKSTLLSLMGLLDLPTAGSLSLVGRDAGQLSAFQRAKIRNLHVGFVFQAFNLLGDLTVAENVALPLEYRRLARGDIRHRVSEVLERVEMAHRASHFPSQLSGGQQQRVALARAVAGAPSLLLADEPTGNLDSANGSAVMSLLEELNVDGTTVCVVTHDATYASRAKRTLKLVDGQLQP